MTLARQPGGLLRASDAGRTRAAQGMGRPPARSRRADLPDGARPQRPRPGGLRQGALSRRTRSSGANEARSEDVVAIDGRGDPARRGPAQQGPADGGDRGPRDGPRVPVALRDAALRRRGPHERHRGAAPRVPLPRSAAAGDAEELRAARRDRVPRAQGAARARISRGRDADAHALDARGRAGLPGAVARAPRPVVRAAAVAPALQADADDLGLRALLPARPLLPRRGPARRPPVRVHADRPRDVLPDGGGRLRRGRGVPGRGVRRGRDRRRAPVPAPRLQGRDGAVRHGPSGPALRPAALRPRRGGRGNRVRAVREGARLRRDGARSARAGGRRVLAQAARRAHREGARARRRRSALGQERGGGDHFAGEEGPAGRTPGAPAGEGRGRRRRPASHRRGQGVGGVRRARRAAGRSRARAQARRRIALRLLLGHGVSAARLRRREQVSGSR